MIAGVGTDGTLVAEAIWVGGVVIGPPRGEVGANGLPGTGGGAVVPKPGGGGKPIGAGGRTFVLI